MEKKVTTEELLTEIAPLSRELLQLATERGRLTVREAVILSGANRNTILNKPNSAACGDFVGEFVYKA